MVGSGWNECLPNGPRTAPGLNLETSVSEQNPLEAFLEAQKRTQVIRARRNALFTFGVTRMPYIFLGDSVVNEGDVVLRRGEVTVAPPRIIAPRDGAEFEGFELGDEGEMAIPVLINRWVKFPPAKYQNSGGAMEVVDGPLEGAVERELNRLDQKSDSRTGILHGPAETWGFSVLGYVGQMIVRSAPSNIGEYFERFGIDGLPGELE